MMSFFERNSFLSFLIAIIIAILIFYISSLTLHGSGGGGYLSYIYHFTAFAYLSLFLSISLTKGSFSIKMTLFVILLSIFYGTFDEVHQYFVPGRNSSIKDILINSIGVLITSLAYMNYCSKKIPK